MILTVRNAHREIIAVDETKVTINGKLYMFWAAVEICSWVSLVYGSPKGMILLKHTVFLHML
jgi:transposase-like protein